ERAAIKLQNEANYTGQVSLGESDLDVRCVREESRGGFWGRAYGKNRLASVSKQQSTIRNWGGCICDGPTGRRRFSDRSRKRFRLEKFMRAISPIDA
ncbi:MAG: hypothetical protein QF898_12845, partial [SAR202 cluster bacterium]|nr:hypothetical protein [SAR202 cluster bacterium]